MPVPTSFKLKHFDQIVASMLNWVASVQSKVTDFNIGSVLRTLLESIAMEIEELYYRMVSALEQEIPNSAYEAFGFPRLLATPATGLVTFGRSTVADQDYLIPVGTLVSTLSGVTFQTVAAVTLPTGLTAIQASVLAVQPGSAGNVASNSIVILNGATLGIETVTNPLATTGGTDQETDDARSNRFRLFIDALPRTTVGGLEGGALTAVVVDGNGVEKERVRQAKTVEPYLTGDGPRGVVDLYIDNGSGVASSALIAATQSVIDGSAPGVEPLVVGYRAAGVIVNVLSVTAVPVAITTTIAVEPGFTVSAVQAEVQVAISVYITGLSIHDELDWERLLTVIITTGGVKTAVITAPTVDQVPDVGQRITAGTITVNVM